MRLQSQLGFFDLDNRTRQLTELGDPLVGLKERVDWEAFRCDLSRVHERNRKSNAGAKPFDVVLMFQVLVLQQLHNLSDDRTEYAIRDRLTFMRFLGLSLGDRVPDAKTIWVFRERLKVLDLVEVLFARFHEQLAAQGYAARGGQMIDATFIEVPRQRNSREENERIKAGETPPDWQRDEAHAKRRQKDVDARWAKKGDETHYGYKNHINADQENKCVQAYHVTDASVHDSQVTTPLLDEHADEQGQKRALYADGAYPSEALAAQLAAAGIPNQICERGYRTHPLTEQQKASNRIKSRIRARVEHVFGAQAHLGGHLVRTVGIARARVKIGLMNLVYNIVRLGQLLKRDGRVSPVMV
jgi:transposase, IS5 family